jgi:hypothetical protein
MNNDIDNRQLDAELGDQCPHCAHRGRAVDTQTVKAMLAVSLYAMRPTHYYFCQSEDCPIVYFGGDGQQSFTEAELRERVYQKHPQDDELLICYCFNHTLGSIREEWRQRGQSSVIEAITAGTQSDQCACDIRNPQGSCCLGNVRRFVRQIMQESSRSS